MVAIVPLAAAGASLAIDLLFYKFRPFKSAIKRYFVKRATKKLAYQATKAILKSGSQPSEQYTSEEKQKIIYVKSPSEKPVWTTEFEKEKEKMIAKAEQERLQKLKYEVALSQYYDPYASKQVKDVENLPSGGIRYQAESGETVTVEPVKYYSASEGKTVEQIAEYRQPPPPPPPIIPTPTETGEFILTAGKPKPKDILRLQENRKWRGYTVGRCDYALGYETQKWGYLWR
jgi:hypothetical protein